MTQSLTSSTIFFSVCIITFQRPILLSRCLACIAPGCQTLNPTLYEVIVSDDCLQQTARPVVESTGFALWFQGPSNGIAANRNSVVHRASGAWIVFVDDDELPTPQWLEHLYCSAISGDWDAIVGRVEPVEYPDSIFWYAPTLRGGVFGAGNLAINKDFLLRCGGFDHTLTTSHEDIDLGNRIVALGGRIHYHDFALVFHPARKMTFREVISRNVQQQCQTYRLYSRNVSPHFKTFPSLLFWSLQYLVRTFRIQVSSVGLFRWRKFVLETLLRIACSPIAIFKLLHD